MASARDKWLVDYESCAQLGQDVMEKIATRNRNPKGSTAYTKECAHIRSSLHQFSAHLNNLRQDLVSTGMRYSMTQRELERRQAQLDQLSTKEKQLDQAFKNNGRTEFGNRSSLLDMGPGSINSNPWDATPSVDPTGISFDDIRQQQQHAIREQDEGLDVLSQVLSRQKQMATDIGAEVDGQNELIDDIGDHVSSTDQRLLRETRHVKIVDRKSNTCGYWVVIILLFIAIFIIAVVPYGGKA